MHFGIPGQIEIQHKASLGHAQVMTGEVLDSSEVIGNVPGREVDGAKE